MMTIDISVLDSTSSTCCNNGPACITCPEYNYCDHHDDVDDEEQSGEATAGAVHHEPTSVQHLITRSTTMNTLSLKNAPKATGRLSMGDLDDMTEVKAKVEAKAQEKKRLLSPTANEYLMIALEKGRAAPHANFLAVASPTTIEIISNIREALERAFELGVERPNAIAIYVAKALRADARAYTTFFKNIAADVAFHANLEINQLNRRTDPGAIDAGLDALGEMHGFDPSDLPAYDVGDATRAAETEAYAGTVDEPKAEDEQDAEDAVERVQEFCSLAMVGLKPEQQAYWGVDGVFPLAQRKHQEWNPALSMYEKVYTPITSFDDYRSWQLEQWAIRRAQQNRVDTDNVEQLLDEA